MGRTKVRPKETKKCKNPDCQELIYSDDFCCDRDYNMRAFHSEGCRDRYYLNKNGKRLTTETYNSDSSQFMNLLNIRIAIDWSIRRRKLIKELLK